MHQKPDCESNIASSTSTLLHIPAGLQQKQSQVRLCCTFITGTRSDRCTIVDLVCHLCLCVQSYEVVLVLWAAAKLGCADAGEPQFI
jgi:hypothetical protein